MSPSPTKFRHHRLDLTKITPGQLPLLAQLLVFFNGERMHAERRRTAWREPSEYIHPIAITKLYETFNVIPKNRKVVIFAANVFFERRFRGNQVSKKCSGWALRPRPKVNAQLLRLLKVMFDQNAEHITQVRSVVMTPADQPTNVTIEVTTTFTLSGDQGKQLLTILQLLQGSTLDKEAA